MPVINMLKGLLEKVDIIQDQMGNFSKEMEAVRKNKRNVIHTHTLTESWRARILSIGSFAGLPKRESVNLIDRYKLIIGDLNTPFSAIDRSRQKINEDTKDLNKTTNWLYLIDIYRTLQPSTPNPHYFQVHMEPSPWWAILSITKQTLTNLKQYKSHK